MMKLEQVGIKPKITMSNLRSNAQATDYCSATDGESFVIQMDLNQGISSTGMEYKRQRFMMTTSI